MYLVTVTLADGTRHESTVARLRYWRSLAMQAAPYAADFRGATFDCREIVDNVQDDPADDRAVVDTLRSFGIVR